MIKLIQKDEMQHNANLLIKLWKANKLFYIFRQAKPKSKIADGKKTSVQTDKQLN